MGKLIPDTSIHRLRELQKLYAKESPSPDVNDLLGMVEELLRAQIDLLESLARLMEECLKKDLVRAGGQEAAAANLAEVRASVEDARALVSGTE